MADNGLPINNYPGNTGKNDKQYSYANGYKMASDTVSATVSSEGGDAGGINNMQPYIAVNFIIAVKGTSAPRP
jgi:microcystin-dependent protein